MTVVISSMATASTASASASAAPTPVAAVDAKATTESAKPTAATAAAGPDAKSAPSTAPSASSKKKKKAGAGGGDAASSSGGGKKAKDGKIYESSVLPNQWTEVTKVDSADGKVPAGSSIDRTIWMLTVQDPKANKKAGADAAAGSASKIDPASGLVFPDMFYLLGERVSVGKRDAMQLAKCFKGTGHDTAEWPSGLITVKCGRCDQKVEDGVMTIQKHLRLIGKTGEKKITCRLMPRLICNACYTYSRDACTATGALLPTDMSSHKSYWVRWAELQPLVDVLSKDFISTMSSKISNGRATAPVQTNEHGIQTIRYVSKDEAAAQQKAAESGAAALTAPSSDAKSLFEPAASATPLLPADLSKCGGCGKAEAGASTKFAACGRCGRVAYCGKECQKSHWTVHKLVCTATPTHACSATRTHPPLTHSCHQLCKK